jgi:serine/threonine protein kinase
VQEVVTFSVGGDYWANPMDSSEEHFFISIEQPNLTLGGVVQGMLGSEECQRDSAVRQRYATKVFSLLRIVAKALRHLHSMGIAHGKLNLENCCKFDDKWKLSDALGLQKVGVPIRVSRLCSSSPPESFEPLGRDTKHQATFRAEYECSPAMDSWAFGKMAYEVLVGRDLIQLDKNKRFEDDRGAMMDILHWKSFNCEEVRQELLRVGVPDAGADLIGLCLAPDPENRPTSDEILKHDTWRAQRKSGST